MNAPVLLNLFKELEKSDKKQGWLSNLSLFRNNISKFNDTGAGMLDSINHDIKNYLKKCIFGAIFYSML